MLAERVSTAISDRFKILPPPTVAARLTDGSEIAFSHFRSEVPFTGLTIPSKREEAFVFNIPLMSTRYSIVSVDGLRQSVVQAPGKAYLFDLTSKNEVSLDTVYDSVRFHLPQTAIDGFAYEKGGRRVGGLRARGLGEDDQILYRLALTILPVIQNAAGVTTAFLEYLSLALCEHVIYTYGGASRGARATGGLSPWQIRRACDFIEAHLTGDPTIATLSHECGISTSHFARAFRASLGMTPHSWITKRRLSRAKSMMIEGPESLAEIAIQCGFVDQSHLGRQFLKEEGQSPAQWRRNNVIR